MVSDQLMVEVVKASKDMSHHRSRHYAHIYIGHTLNVDDILTQTQSIYCARRRLQKCQAFQ